MSKQRFAFTLLLMFPAFGTQALQVVTVASGFGGTCNQGSDDHFFGSLFLAVPLAVVASALWFVAVRAARRLERTERQTLSALFCCSVVLGVVSAGALLPTFLRVSVLGEHLCGVEFGENFAEGYDEPLFHRAWAPAQIALLLSSAIISVRGARGSWLGAQ